MCVKRRGDAFASMGLGKRGGGGGQYEALKNQARELKIQGGHKLTQVIE